MATKVKSNEFREAVLAELFQSTDGSLMVIAAHRYALGRSSYLVGSVIDSMSRHWSMLAVSTRNVILRDTAEALLRGEVGMDQDKRAWWHLLCWGFALASADDQAWLRGAVPTIDDLIHSREA